ncbi:MAG: 2-oxoacid:acceptor oxidoreductase subunit alpha [Euryarchaeota archaeon]|nr:2-oxoacid:acceptor oxidoreductase subunit alpha [Euryarchaeota archaeon]
MDFTFRISGMAGDGVKGAGMVAARLFSRLGYHVFVHLEYQSLIRGGHNAALVRVSSRKVRCHSDRGDLLIALQDYVVPRHRNYVERVLYDSSGFSLDEGYALPMGEFARQVKAPPVFRNAAALGALCHLYGVELELLSGIYRDAYGEKAEKDILLAELGYRYAEEHFERIREVKRAGEARALLDGNQSAALGAVKAGLRCYYAYPMTPSTSVLHFLAARRRELGVTVVQPENEIAAAVMAIGSAFAGARVMVGTSGGGFALMQEAFSLAGMAEVPVLFLESQRSGPSTGMPTWHAQQDLRFVLHSGHGEFPRIVASPGDVEDAFYLAGELLNLAWRYQTPAVLLMDRYLSESATTAEIDAERVREEPPLLYRGEPGEYRRYLITDSGVSPLAFPPEVVLKATGNEHDELGFTTDDAEVSSRMYEKRMRKMQGIVEELRQRQAVRTFGEGRDVVFTWGSSTGAAVEAAEELGLKVVQVRYLSPFPTWEVEKLSIERAACVECNYTGQLASLLREHACIEAELITRHDGRPFTAGELVPRLEEVFG